MWNYEHEVILNDVTKAVKVSPVDKDGNPTGGADRVVIKNEGSYLLKTEGLDGKVAADAVVPIVNAFKTEGVEGVCQTMELAVPDGGTDTEYYRFAFKIKCDAQTAEFANWAGTFEKPIIFEVKKGATIKEVADAAAMAIAPEFATVDANGLITLASPYFSVAVPASVGEYVKAISTTCDCGGSVVETEEDATAGITVNADRVKPFGTAEELMGIRRDSMTNLRTPAEFPIKGKVYTQFAFDYDSERVLLGGMSAVSQAVASRTHHVFWVPKDDAATFEGLFDGVTFTAIA